MSSRTAAGHHPGRLISRSSLTSYTDANRSLKEKRKPASVIRMGHFGKILKLHRSASETFTEAVGTIVRESSVSQTGQTRHYTPKLGRAFHPVFSFPRIQAILRSLPGSRAVLRGFAWLRARSPTVARRISFQPKPDSRSNAPTLPQPSRYLAVSSSKSRQKNFPWPFRIRPIRFISAGGATKFFAAG